MSARTVFLSFIMVAAVVTAFADKTRLAVSVRPDKPQFRTVERLSFMVTFKNRSAEPVVLEVTDYLGSQTVGQYAARFRNVTTGDLWRLWQDPALPQPGAPAAQQTRTLGPGEGMELTYSPVASVAQGPEFAAPVRTAPHLPPGDYELLLSISDAGMRIKPAPAAFSIVAVDPMRPLEPVERAHIILQARQALAEQLTTYAKAEKEPAGSGNLPGGNRYASLRAENFAAELEQGNRGALVKFSFELPNTDRVLTWSVGVSEGRVDPNYRMFGFVVQPTHSPRAPAPVAAP